MTNSLVFDTHQFIKTLVNAGFSSEQAEALSTEQIKLLNDNLATKQDIAQLKLDMEKMKSDMEKTIVQTNTNTIKWNIGTIGIFALIISVSNLLS